MIDNFSSSCNQLVDRAFMSFKTANPENQNKRSLSAFCPSYSLYLLKVKSVLCTTVFIMLGISHVCIFYRVCCTQPVQYSLPTFGRAA